MIGCPEEERGEPSHTSDFNSPRNWDGQSLNMRGRSKSVQKHGRSAGSATDSRSSLYVCSVRVVQGVEGGQPASTATSFNFDQTVCNIPTESRRTKTAIKRDPTHRSTRTSPADRVTNTSSATHATPSLTPNNAALSLVRLSITAGPQQGSRLHNDL